MPALPWVAGADIDPETEYVVMASHLPLAHYRAVPGFLRDTLAIRKQLAGAPGMVGYGLKADLVRKQFWTYSVWRDEQALHEFARSAPHRLIMSRLRPHMGATRFVTTTAKGSEIAEDWSDRAALTAAPSGGVA
jgi:hypothetical protein